MEAPHTEANQLLGNCLRLVRRNAGLTQLELAEAIGISGQQVQKYEKGTNRIPAEVLMKLSLKLQIPIRHFFPVNYDDKTNDNLDVLRDFNDRMTSMSSPQKKEFADLLQALHQALSQ